MKLILLRHEKRENYPGFFSNLVEDGFKDSIKLVKKLDKLNIDIIYCSPLVRTLQTIHPYCKKNNIKVNLEYALYEYKHNPYFLLEQEMYGVKDIKNKDLTSIINKKCKPKFKKSDFNYNFLESENDLENRLNIFLHFIQNNKKLKNKTVLFVSHKGVINKIKQILNFDITMDDEFPKGHFEIINY